MRRGEGGGGLRGLRVEYRKAVLENTHLQPQQSPNSLVGGVDFARVPKSDG